MNPLIADIHDLQRTIMLKDAIQDKKIDKVKELTTKLSEMAIQDDNCLEVLEKALAIMCRIKYKNRIISLPNLLIEKH
jgi:hypothetical protein